jgi:Ubiquinol-cytochrome-c reductase complex assembly factor 3
MARVLKSAFYLVGFSSFGYILMKLLEPSEEKKTLIKGNFDVQSPENRRKTELLMQKIKESAGIKSNENTEKSKQPSKREIN